MPEEKRHFIRNWQQTIYLAAQDYYHADARPRL
jgi:hypothetical protein